MKILVCYKYIRNDEEIYVNPDRTMNVDSAAWVISPYDLNAIEAAMKLAAAAGDSSVEVITVGCEVLDNSKMRKAVLSRGPAKMYGIRTDCCGDLYSTAVLLKQGIDRIGDVDFIICGEGSGDMYTQELGNVLGAVMGIPAINAVDSLGIEDGCVMARRNNGGRLEKLKISGQAVISVTSDICPAHIPSMKDIMASGKKPVELFDAAELEKVAASAETVSVLAPESGERMKVVYKANDDEGIDNFVKALKKYM